MLAKITLYDGTIYRIADKTTDTEDGIYLGRIKDELSLVSAMQEAGNAPNTVNLTIINHDSFIPHNKDLWAAEVLLTNENNISWRGKINFCNFDADGNLYVTASEKTAPELELQLPDEVRQVYTVDEDFHQSSVTMTIPLVVGGTSSNPIALPTILIDKTRGIYLICVGEIRSVVKVYNGAKELPQTAYTAYTGTSSQAEHAGFAYVQIAEDYRLNADGSYAEINVEVVGLKLGNFTEEECRNGALFLYYFLTTAATGINGWGCGIDSNLIDSDSFQSAITLCNQFGYKLDGIMWLRQSAQSWIDQICQAIHGKYSINANGKRSLFIDYAGNASKKTFTASNMQVERYGKNSYTSVVYNKGILNYDYNPKTGLFMQSAQYENAESIAQIGEQKFVGESYLIKDATTALAVLEYTCKRSQIAAEAIEFRTDDVETNLRAGDIITINRPDLSLNNALYQIQSISTTDFISNITAVKFDTSVFSVTGTAPTVNWGNEKAITPALTPAQATNLLLSAGFDINPDGTGIPYISGTFTVPDGGWLAAAVQYGIGTNPQNWTELSLITEGKFKLSPVNVGTVYSIRVRMITPTGHSDYTTGQITATGDSDAPSEPSCTAATYLKTIRITVALTNPPADLAGFEIWRSNIGGSPGSKIGYIAAINGSATYVDIEAADYLTNFYYSAIAVDKWGNRSGYSNQAVASCSKIQAHEVEADWVISNLMETAIGVGEDVDGVKLDSTGIEGWYGGERYIDLNSGGNSTIGGWSIDKDRLYSNNIEIISGGIIRTMDYVSGYRGWQIDKYGKAEFQDATIRGTVTSVNFVKDTVSAVGGSLMILGAAEVQSCNKTTVDGQTILCEDWVDLVTENNDKLITEQSGTSAYYSIVVDDASIFNPNDILRIRDVFAVQDLWLGLVSKSGNTLNCVMLYGTALELEAGMTVVNYGHNGSGGILLDGNAPKIDMFTHNGEPWRVIDNYLRIGNLNGFLGYTSNQYGIAIGNDDAYLKYDPVNSLRIKGNIESTYLTANSENVILGTSANPWLLVNSAGATFSGNIKVTDNNIRGRNFIEAHGEYANSETDYVTSDFKISRGSIGFYQNHYTDSSKTTRITENVLELSPVGISATTLYDNKNLSFSASLGTISGTDTDGHYIVRSDFIKMARDAGGEINISYDYGFQQSKDDNNYSSFNQSGVSFRNLYGSASISCDVIQIVSGGKTLFEYSRDGSILIASIHNDNNVSIGINGIGTIVDGVPRFKTWAEILG